MPAVKERCGLRCVWWQSRAAKRLENTAFEQRRRPKLDNEAIWVLPVWTTSKRSWGGTKT